MTERGSLMYVKTVIHSLIVSSPDRMTVEGLNQDYAREEGTPVPFSKFGFKDIVSFLSSISDTVVLQGYGHMATVFAKSKAETAHIQNLVRTQKKSSNRRRGRGKQRFGHNYNRSDIVFVNERFNGRYPQHYNRNNNCSQPLQQYQNQAPDESLIQKFSNMRTAPVGDDSSSDENYSNEIYVQKGVPGEAQSQSNNISNDYHSSDEDRDVEAVLAYKRNNNENDINLVNVADGVPKICTNEIEPLVQYVSSDEGNDSDAIPAYAVDERVMSMAYPREAVRFDHQLPQRSINNKFKVEDRIEVQLVTVSSPHNFNFWLCDDDFEDYKNMTSNMQRFYKEVDEIKYTIPLFHVMPGHLGAISVRNTLWYRVQVLDTKTGNCKNIEVELVDTGERLWICHTDLKYLSKEFATLPPQYWPGRLACVRPRHGSFFSVEASNYFYDLVCYRRLYAKVDQINEADNTLYLVLVDPYDALITKNINVALIESGWVRRSLNP